MKTKLLLWALLIVSITSVKAQTEPIPPATFTIISQLDKASADTLKFEGVFIITADKIQWGPDKANLTELDKVAAEGSWEAKNGMGIVSYDVKLNESTGTVKVTGTDTHLIIDIAIDLDAAVIDLRMFASTFKYN